MSRTVLSAFLCALILVECAPAPAAAGEMVRPALSIPSGIAQLQVDPLTLEQALSRHTFGFLKAVRRWTVRVTRFLQRSFDNWGTWLLLSAAFLSLGAIASAIDLRLVRVWWNQGWSQAGLYALVGAAVFFHLLKDRRVGRWSRLILVAALVYVILPRDAIPARVPIFGWVDDVIVMSLAARWYVRRCPDEIVQEHAEYVRARSGAHGAASPS